MTCLIVLLSWAPFPPHSIEGCPSAPHTLVFALSINFIHLSYWIIQFIRPSYSSIIWDEWKWNGWVNKFLHFISPLRSSLFLMTLLFIPEKAALPWRGDTSSSWNWNGQHQLLVFWRAIKLLDLFAVQIWGLCKIFQNSGCEL